MNYSNSSNKNPDEHNEETKKNIQKGNLCNVIPIIAVDETKDKTFKIDVNTFISKVNGVIDEKLKHLITVNSLSSHPNDQNSQNIIGRLDDVAYGNKSSKRSSDAKELDGSAPLKPQYKNNKFSEEDWSAEAKNRNPRKRKKDEVDEEDEDYNNIDS